MKVNMIISTLLVVSLFTTSCTVNQYVTLQNASSTETRILDLPLESGRAYSHRLKKNETARHRSGIARTVGISMPLIQIYNGQTRTSSAITSGDLSYPYPESYIKYEKRWASSHWLSQLLGRRNALMIFKDQNQADFYFRGKRYPIQGAVDAD